jgi:hypothetical protein
MTSSSLRIGQEVEGTDPNPDRIPTDRALADRILRANVELQEAMDSAILAGLIVEPDFTQINGRVTKAGVKVDSFVCKVKIFRKLA